MNHALKKNKSQEKKQVENKGSVTKSMVATGPLVVSKINPRYFTVASDNTPEKKNSISNRVAHQQ